jgi:hypothetical protein
MHLFGEMTMSKCDSKLPKPILYYVTLTAMIFAFTLVVLQAAGA